MEQQGNKFKKSPESPEEIEPLELCRFREKKWCLYCTVNKDFTKTLLEKMLKIRWDKTPTAVVYWFIHLKP